MKIRNGFVSNSSSSSYIVRVKDTTWDEFCNLVVADKGFYYREELVHEIDEEIVRFETSIKEAKEDKNKILSTMIPMYKDKLVELKKLKKSMPKDNDIEALVTIALKFNGIKYDVDKDVKEVELRSFTSMHNSFDDMPMLMREIVLALMFDTGKKLKCERIDDGN